MVPVWAWRSEIDCAILLTNNWWAAFGDAAGRITSDHELQKGDTGSGSGEEWSDVVFGVKAYNKCRDGMMWGDRG